MFTSYSIAQPDDVDFTHEPLIDGSLDGIAIILNDGTYRATRQDYTDGVEQGEPVLGTVTVADGEATFEADRWHLLMVDAYEVHSSHLFDTEAEAKTASEDIARAYLLSLGPESYALAEDIEEAPTDVWLDENGSDIFITRVTAYAPARAALIGA